MGAKHRKREDEDQTYRKDVRICMYDVRIPNGLVRHAVGFE